MIKEITKVVGDLDVIKLFESPTEIKFEINNTNIQLNFINELEVTYFYLTKEIWTNSNILIIHTNKYLLSEFGKLSNLINEVDSIYYHNKNEKSVIQILKEIIDIK